MAPGATDLTAIALDRRCAHPNELSPYGLTGKRISFAGSLIGGIETQDVMDFCDLHGIKPDYPLVELPKINATWDDVVAKKARCRYVIDMKKA